MDTEVRHCRRRPVKRDGSKPVFQELQQQPKKKKPRCKPLTASLSEESPRPGSSTDVPPPTPIRVIQDIGRDLQIPDEQLTVDKLMANPGDESKSGGDV